MSSSGYKAHTFNVTFLPVLFGYSLRNGMENIPLEATNKASFHGIHILPTASNVCIHNSYEHKACTVYLFCSLPFGVFSRMHHCRLCGSVLCRRPTCSSGFIPLKRHHDDNTVHILACPKCHAALFHAATHTEPIEDVDDEGMSRLLTEYTRLQQRKTQIQSLLHQYEIKLAELQTDLGDHPETTDENAINRQQSLGNEVESCRETALLVLTFYEAIARGIRDMNLAAATKTNLSLEQMQKQVQTEIFRAAVAFVQTNKLRLRLKLPELLADTATSGSAAGETQQVRRQSLRRPSSTLTMRLQSLMDAALPAATTTSIGPQLLPQKTKDVDSAVVMANLPALLQKMHVLQEQRSQLELQVNILASTLVTGTRKDDAEREMEKAALREAIDDIDDEMRRIQMVVAQAPPP